MCLQLLGLHTLSECDATSYPHGTRKTLLAGRVITFGIFIFLVKSFKAGRLH